MAKWQYKNRAYQVKRKWEKDVWSAMQDTAQMIEETCKNSLGTAGKPGNRSYTLYKSIKCIARRRKDIMENVLYSTAPYARRLELGFVGKVTYVNEKGTVVTYEVKQTDRPFMRPAIENSKKDVLRHLGRKARF